MQCHLGGDWHPGWRVDPTYVYVSQNVFLLGHLNLLKHWRVPSLSVRFTCEGCLQKITTIFLPFLVHQMPNGVRSINKIHQTKNISPTWTSPKKHPSQKFVHHQVAVQRYFLWLIREVLQPLEGHPSDESQSLVCKSHKDRVVRPLPYIASFKRLKKKEGLENQPQKTTFGPSPGEPNPPVAISFPPICPNQNISPT